MRSRFWSQRFKAYAQLMRLDKPVGTILFIAPSLWGLFIASDGRPSLKLLLIFILGAFLVRSAGCVINDFADRHIDGFVERTKARPLAQKRVTPFEALLLFAILSLLALKLVTYLNPLCIQLSVVVICFAIAYPFLKRVTHLPQLILGMTCSLGVPMAFAAVQNTVPLIGWYLYCIAGIWSVAYDTQYAMVDRQDDLKIDVKSTAILFGELDVMIVMLLQATVLMMLITLGVALGVDKYYYFMLIFGAILLGYQWNLIKERDPKGCFQAFLSNQWFGIVVTLAIILR